MPEQSALPSHDVTALLQAWSQGDDEALQKLMPLVYGELHRAARRHMAGERPSHTLQPTALIHEVYLRLADAKGIAIQDRSHFLAVCARLMRHILTDFARSRHYQKRGGAALHLALDEALVVSSSTDPDLAALDDALTKLAAVDLRKSQVVELRFFGGLSVAESAEALKVSPETVLRDWKLAKVWLLRELDRPNGP
jgi:RNA polymerase sigma factor (TIGR02999 family)